MDWPHVIEEIEALGRSELNGVRSLMGLALLHAMKIVAWPGHSARGHWEHEAAGFLLQARLGYQPSMRQRLDLPDIHARAMRDLRGLRMDGAAPGPLADALALEAEEIFDQGMDVSGLVARLTPPSTPPAPR